MTAMSNQIRKTSVEVRRLSAAEAEVWIEAEPAAVTATTALRGRLVGPRCPGVSTVEVAYLFRPLPPTSDRPAERLAVRVLIPEPNLWTEETPFFYEGSLELWQDEERQDSVRLSVALKVRT